MRIQVIGKGKAEGYRFFQVNGLPGVNLPSGEYGINEKEEIVTEDFEEVPEEWYGSDLLRRALTHKEVNKLNRGED